MEPPPPPQPLPPAGWYPDPDDPGHLQRYWDGRLWTDSRAPADTPIVNPEEPPQALNRLRTLAIGGLAVIGVLEIVNIVADALYIGVLDEQIAGEAPPASEIDDVQGFVDGSSLALSFGLLFLGPVSFLLWFYRAYSNLRRLGLHNLRYTPGWAVGSWFIPFFNLVRPKQIANDLYRATADGKLHSSGPIDSHPVSPLLHWWWAVYILTAVVSLFAASYYSDDDPFSSELGFDSLADERAFYVGDLIASASGLAAAALAIAVVRRISSDQQAVIATPPATLDTFASPPPG